MKVQQTLHRAKTYIFAFTCTLDFAVVADALQISKLKCSTIADSGASCHSSPDKLKFLNYFPLKNCHVTTANRCTSKALGMGDIKIDLPNGPSCSIVILRDSVYAPDLTFTLISILWLNLTKCGALFKDGKCTISYPDGRVESSAISKGINNMCYQVWRVSLLGSLGSCYSPESGWTLICGSMEGWYDVRDETIL